MLRILTLTFCAFLLVPPALAEEVPSSPGWSLSSSTSQEQEENVYGGNQRVFYSLKPPDQRPAISIDAATADRVRKGEMPAEAAYMGQGAKPKKDEEEFVYGSHGNGIQMADTVNSTLTGEEGRKDVDYSALSARTRGPASSDSSGGSMSAGMGSGGNNAAGRNVAAKALSMGGVSPGSAPVGAQDTSGASSPAAAADGGAPTGDPRAAAAASPATIAAPTTVTPVVAVNNVASGFGMSTSSNTDTSFSLWPNGDPATSTNTGVSTSTVTATGTIVATCPSTVVFSTAMLQRLAVPSGCSGVKIDAFGAGGGLGSPAGAAADSASLVADGGGGAFVHGEGPVDTTKYELVVVVGSPGGDAKSGTAGLAGFIGGGTGGPGGGGGGGGYSGVFLVDKTKFANGETPQLPDKALVVAAGGGGGSAVGGPGGPGGTAQGGGTLGATQAAGGPAQGNGLPGAPLRGGGGGTYGGGGGGGFWGGGGGGSGAGDAEGGGGGSSLCTMPAATAVMTAATGTTAGNGTYATRGEAGNAGKTGLVVVTFY